jgi:hypothetical protein
MRFDNYFVVTFRSSALDSDNAISTFCNRTFEIRRRTKSQLHKMAIYLHKIYDSCWALRTRETRSNLIPPPNTMTQLRGESRQLETEQNPDWPNWGWYQYQSERGGFKWEKPGRVQHREDSNRRRCVGGGTHRAVLRQNQVGSGSKCQ